MFILNRQKCVIVHRSRDSTEPNIQMALRVVAGKSK